MATKRRHRRKTPFSIHPGTTSDGYSYDRRGIITDPGKFEGEPRYVPHFWNLMLDGLADSEDDEGWASFSINAQDKATWPELKGVKLLHLHEDDRGFVFSSFTRYR